MDENTVADHELTRWLNGMQTFMIALNRPATLGQLLNLVTVTACDLLGFDFCGVLLVRPEQRRLMIEGAHGLSSKYVAEINDALTNNPELINSDPSGKGWMVKLADVAGTNDLIDAKQYQDLTAQ